MNQIVLLIVLKFYTKFILTNSHGYEQQFWSQPIGEDALDNEDGDGDQHEGKEYKVGNEKGPIVLPQTVEGKTVAQH